MNYIITTSDGDSLTHHGILGQKWGKMNGPPYPLGSDDHSDNEKKEGYKRSLGGGRNEELYERNRKAQRQQKKAEKKQNRDEALKQHYMKQGQTEAEAIKSAEQYKKIVKGLAIAGATAVLAGGAIYAYSKLDKYGSDFIIKKGQAIYRVASADSQGALQDVFYATPDKMDFAKYRADWGRRGLFQYKAAKTFVANKDVRIAGNETAKRLFKELQSNPEFAKQVEGVVQRNRFGLPGGTSDWVIFNTFAPLERGANANAFTMFKDYVQQHGFDGIIDFNDKYGQGYGTNAPIIFFGGNTNFSLQNIQQLDDNLINAAKAEFAKLQQNKETIKELMDTTSTYGLAYGSGILALAGIEAVSLEAMANELEKKKENSK